MKIHLAPMEGVVDAVVRDLWTRIGGYDLCFTEFIRVTNQLIPEHVFYRDCPELLQGGTTPSGVPVVVQLLGGDPFCLADNAARAIELGSPGIDLNFGCPAPTVNRHDGGATLLLYPERIRGIVEAVRKAVPADLPVTAKIRLGFLDPNLCLENALAAEAGGAARVTVHCRTKKQMYQPPADWSWIPRLREALKIPVVANGEILTRADYDRCLSETGCDDVMIGRGALANPWLAHEIRAASQGQTQSTPWTEIQNLAERFFDYNERCISPAFAVARTKQMYRYFSKSWPQAKEQFQTLKLIREGALFRSQLTTAFPSEGPVTPILNKTLDVGRGFQAQAEALSGPL